MHSKTGFIFNEEGKNSENDNESDSSSTGEDEDAFELTEDVEKKFFRTLSCLKKKDPQIYDKEARFFEKEPEIDESILKEKRRNKTETPLTLREYEKNLLLNGKLLNNDDYPVNESKKKTYVEEQTELKNSFKKILGSGSDDDGDDIGFFRERSKSKAEKEREEEDFRKWLKGQRNEIDDKEAEGDMKFLHDYWNDPNLDQDETFLRDYILNKRFLDNDDSRKDNPDKWVTLEEDEQILNDQTQFEHKFNFRFEEPDQEFIKRYPRVMENSMRQKDNKRKLKREAVKQRKKVEKERKMKELKKLQVAKHKEIEEKIQKIKEATGNEELGFKDEDIEKEFDPNEHDRQMQKLFSDEFYNQEEDNKPVFTEDLDLDQYEDDDGNSRDDYQAQNNIFKDFNYGDEDINMDCDYTPEKAALAKKIKLEARQKKKNKTRLISAKESIMLNQNSPKPVFDKKLHTTFQNYLDEYYSLDCEDFIDDMPCRFKYKQVVPNSFGLTIEEILSADDKELNKWCSLNKMYHIRPVKEEKYDVKAYKLKANNEKLKRQILQSLYKSEENEGESVLMKKKKKRKKKKNMGFTEEVVGENVIKDVDESKEIKENKNKRKLNVAEGNLVENDPDKSGNNQYRKKLKTSEDNISNKITFEADFGTNSNNQKTKKFKRNVDVKISCEDETINYEQNYKGLGNGKVTKTYCNTNDIKSKKKSKLFQKSIINTENSVILNSNGIKNKSEQLNSNKKSPKFNKSTKKKKNDLETFYNDISDSRLKAYGIKPKKFKNKLKYGSVK